jgi:hypothetical protein
MLSANIAKYDKYKTDKSYKEMTILDYRLS